MDDFGIFNFMGFSFYRRLLWMILVYVNFDCATIFFSNKRIIEVGLWTRCRKNMHQFVSDIGFIESDAEAHSVFF